MLFVALGFIFLTISGLILFLAGTLFNWVVLRTVFQFGEYFGTSEGMLVAWDPVKQQARWTIEQPWPWNGGTLATAGNLLFQGDPYGVFRARAADTGKELWSFDAQRGIMAGPVTFRAGGGCSASSSCRCTSPCALDNASFTSSTPVRRASSANA